jgi:hypothetical protein
LTEDAVRHTEQPQKARSGRPKFEPEIFAMKSSLMCAWLSIILLRHENSCGLLDQALKLAQEELELARPRFEAQVTTQIDVVNAQTQLADARSRQVNAVYALKSAEIEYQRATGVEIR